MRIKTFSGDFYEIGKQQGKIYSKNGMSLSYVKINPKLYRNQLKIYQRYYPELLEEFKGIAEAGNFDKDKLIYSFLCEEILFFLKKFHIKPICTIFGVKNKNGVFVGRNYDWIPITEKFFKVYKVLNPKRNSFIAVTDMGILNKKMVNSKFLYYTVVDAINDKGLYIGFTFAYCKRWSFGLSCVHMAKLITETCSNVKEAIKVFENVPLCCPKNFFIADKNGQMVAIEHIVKKFKVVYPNNDILIKTNHYIDPELAKEDLVLKIDRNHSTFRRYYEVFRKISAIKEKLKQSDIVEILKDKKSGIYQDNKKRKTIWTLSLNMINRNYMLYWGLPEKRRQKILKI
jgi:predicted choloylglycine hydrolase